MRVEASRERGSEKFIVCIWTILCCHWMGGGGVIKIWVGAESVEVAWSILLFRIPKRVSFHITGLSYFSPNKSARNSVPQRLYVPTMYLCTRFSKIL